MLSACFQWSCSCKECTLRKEKIESSDHIGKYIAEKCYTNAMMSKLESFKQKCSIYHRSCQWFSKYSKPLYRISYVISTTVLQKFSFGLGSNKNTIRTQQILRKYPIILENIYLAQFYSKKLNPILIFRRLPHNTVCSWKLVGIFITWCR